MFVEEQGYIHLDEDNQPCVFESWLVRTAETNPIAFLYSEYAAGLHFLIVDPAKVDGGFISRHCPAFWLA